MRYFVLVAALAASAAHAEPSAISQSDLQKARGLGGTYRQCLQDTLGERYLGAEASQPLKLASDIEASCLSQLQPVQGFLAARGYASGLVHDAVVDIKARADGAAIAAVHRLPPYRY
ncbi:MAG: hypothetical protein ACREVL_03670 [Solimonas sp.]